MGGNSFFKVKKGKLQVSLPDVNFYCETPLPNANDHSFKFSTICYLQLYYAPEEHKNIHTVSEDGIHCNDFHYFSRANCFEM